MTTPILVPSHTCHFGSNWKNPHPRLKASEVFNWANPTIVSGFPSPAALGVAGSGRNPTPKIEGWGTQLQFSPPYKQSQLQLFSATSLPLDHLQTNGISDISGLDKISWTRPWVSIGCGYFFLGGGGGSVPITSAFNQPWRNVNSWCQTCDMYWHVGIVEQTVRVYMPAPCSDLCS